jgi:hypothetical protein
VVPLNITEIPVDNHVFGFTVILVPQDKGFIQEQVDHPGKPLFIPFG